MKRENKAQREEKELKEEINDILQFSRCDKTECMIRADEEGIFKNNSETVKGNLY